MITALGLYEIITIIISYIKNSNDSFLADEMTKNIIFKTIKAFIKQHYLFAKEVITKIVEQLTIYLTN